MTIRELFDLYLGWCSRHRSASTAKQYRSRLRGFVTLFGDREPTAVTGLDVEQWYASACKKQNGSDKAPDSIRSAAIAFGALQSWAVEHNAIPAGWVKKLEKPRGRRRERLVSAAEHGRILAAASTQFRLMYLALRQSGARPGELAGATVAHWQGRGTEKSLIELVEHKTARKTGRTRKIPVGGKLAGLLEQALGDRTEGPIFLNDRGLAWTTDLLGRNFRAIREQLGLPAELVLYSTRHWHATELNRKFGIRAAQAALGHASITTTERYVHITDTELTTNQDAIE